MGRPRSSIETCGCEESRCAWGWKRPAIPAGSSDCWPSWVSKCGSAIPRRSRPGASRNRRPIGKMRSLQALAMNEGRRWKKKLFSEQGRAELEKLALAPWASRRRRELLELLDRMDPIIEELTAAAEQEAHKRPEALRLMTHPGVGPLTALAYVLIIGTPSRFHRG